MAQPPISLTILRQGDTNIVDLAEVGSLIPRGETRVDDAFLQEVSAEVRSVAIPEYSRGEGLVVQELQRLGSVLFSHLLPAPARQRLRTAPSCDLYLRLDEALLPVPWELSYDGEQFLATKFRLGRQVITSHSIPHTATARTEQGPLRVLLIADPTETLPQAAAEVERLCELLGDVPGVEVTLLGGREIRKVPLLAALEAHEVVHFAGHSEYDAQTPSKSGWVLQEGVLTAGELGKLSHPPLLVFSNSCQAGVTAAWQSGARYEGQAFGIGSAFLLAGVSNYIGTFWVVHDEESVAFASAFYERLTVGQSLGAALLEARQTLSAQSGGQSLTWASYLLYGDPCFTLLATPHDYSIPAGSTTPRPQPVGVLQRKLAALLSADVKGYSRLMGENEEATVRTLTAYREVMTILIAQYRGRVVDAPGDNVLAEFASAVDAVQCAAAIQQTLKTKNAELPPSRQMQFRIGINVGDVLVEGERLYGDGVNIAARVEGLAEGGGICISGTVYDQIETKLPLQYESLGEQTVKNITKPVRVYRVQVEPRAAAAPMGSEAAKTGEPPRTIPKALLIGRERELEQLQQWSAKALRGERQVVFVTGEPGIGKTTLVDAFLRRVAAQGDLWLGQGQCIEHYGAGEAYLPVLSALGQLCRGPGGQRLRELLGQQAPTWLVQMPVLLNAADFEVLQRKTQGATKERMLRELTEAVEVLTMEKPLVLWLEDLHWSDSSTLDLIAFLARRRQPARLLVIGTARPVDGQKHLLQTVKQELHLHGQCEELAVGFLSESEVAEYLAQRFAAHRLPAALACTIHRRTEGNPLFMHNVVEDLVAQGAIVSRQGQWDLQQDIAEVEIRVPQSLRQLIEQQLARLTPEEQRVVEVGGVAGAEFSAAAVAVGVEAQIEEVEERCEGLARREQLLRAQGTEAWPDGTIAARYGFLHALYQEVVYERVTAGRRSRLHQRIGERLEAAYNKRARDIAAVLAMHFEQGRDHPRAVRYLRYAGENATRRSAHREAISLLTKGLQLLKTLPDIPDRDQQELKLHTALGIPLGATKGYAAPEVEQAYGRALELCRQLGESPQLFPVLGGLCVFYMQRAKFRTAHELAEQLLRLAQRFQHPVFLVWAHLALGMALYIRGELIPARAHLEQSLALYDLEQRHSYGFVLDPKVNCLSELAFVLWLMGYPDQARKRSHEALTLAKELAHPFSLATALSSAAGIHAIRREPQAERERAEELMLLGREQGFSQASVYGALHRGLALVEEGQSEEGIARVSQGMADLHASGADTARPWILASLIKAYGDLGKIEEGLTLIVETLKKEVDAGAYVSQAELYRLKGELLRMQEGSRLQALGRREKTEEAEACFLKAIEIARQQQAKSWELRATSSLARLWQSQGKTEEARKMLAEIYSWFTEGFDTKDLKEAKALLDVLESREVMRQGEKTSPQRRAPAKRPQKAAKSQRPPDMRPEHADVVPTVTISEQSPMLALPNKPSIAVLPFVNLSGDPEQEYFSDGLSEDLMTDLSKFSGLFVIARASAFTYKGKAVKVQEVSKELGVRYVLEGSVRRAGDRVRITAQLVNGLTGYQLWAERYDRELQDIFAVQEELTHQILSNLKVEVRQAEWDRMRRIPTDNLTAYDYLLRGTEAFSRLTRVTMGQARQWFERAIELDPQYAVAYVWLGWTHTMEWAWQWGQDAQILEKCSDLAHLALALDDSLPEAHRLLSEVYLWQGHHNEAIAEGEQAITLNPNDAHSYNMLAGALCFAGKSQAAREVVEQAMRLDPRNREWYLLQVGLSSLLTRQYEEALAAFQKVIRRYPTHVVAHMFLAGLYGRLGREEEARAEAAEVMRLNPDFSVEGVRQRSGRTDPAVLERWLAALRKAGLK